MTDSEHPAPGAGRQAVDPGPGVAAPGGEAASSSAAVAPLADVIARPQQRSSRGTSILLALGAAIAIGGLAFAAGRLTAPAASAVGFRGSGQLPGGQVSGGGQLPGGGQGFPGRGQGLGGMTIQGTVTAATSDSVTIELPSGTTVTIPVDADTAYRWATPATADAVKIGSEVAVTPGSRIADPAASLDPSAELGQELRLLFVVLILYQENLFE